MIHNIIDRIIDFFINTHCDAGCLSVTDLLIVADAGYRCQISLGLSVDMEWQKGLDFTVLLGGVTE